MADKKMVEQITSMEEDFAQWYTDVVLKAELILSLIHICVLGDRDDRGILAVQGLCAFFGMDEKERDLGKY